MLYFRKLSAHYTGAALFIAVLFFGLFATRGELQAQGLAPNQCELQNLSSFELPSLQQRLLVQRSLINEISGDILINSAGNRITQQFVTMRLRRMADRALDQSLRAVAAFPRQVMTCNGTTSCREINLGASRNRIALAGRRNADLALRLLDRTPGQRRGDEMSQLFRDQIEFGLEELLLSLDELPSSAFICPR